MITPITIETQDAQIPTMLRNTATGWPLLQVSLNSKEPRNTFENNPFIGSDTIPDIYLLFYHFLKQLPDTVETKEQHYRTSFTSYTLVHTPSGIKLTLGGNYAGILQMDVERSYFFNIFYTKFRALKYLLENAMDFSSNGDLQDFTVSYQGELYVDFGALLDMNVNEANITHIWNTGFPFIGEGEEEYAEYLEEQKRNQERIDEYMKELEKKEVNMDEFKQFFSDLFQVEAFKALNLNNQQFANEESIKEPKQPRKESESTVQPVKQHDYKQDLVAFLNAKQWDKQGVGKLFFSSKTPEGISVMRAATVLFDGEPLLRSLKTFARVRLDKKRATSRSSATKNLYEKIDESESLEQLMEKIGSDPTLSRFLPSNEQAQRALEPQ